MFSILALATAAAAQPAPPEPIVTGTCAVVPLNVSSTLPIVDVTIDGKGPYRFGIDTGAQGMGRISAQLAAQLNLETVGEVRAPAPGGTLSTRKIFRAARLGVGSIAFGNADLVTMTALPGQPMTWSGILGIDLFRALTLTLDYGGGALKLSHDNVTDGVAASFEGGIPAIPLKIGAKDFTVDLDTGNGAAALFLSEAAAKTVPQSGPARERGKARTSFGDFSVREAPIDLPVTVGGTPLPVHAIGWPSARSEGNLGSNGLAGMVVSVDRPHGRVAIRPSGKALACA